MYSSVAGFFLTLIAFQILNWEQHFNIPDGSRLSEDSKSLIRGLIQHQDHRLGSRHGATDIKKHPFFCCKCCTCGTVHCKCEHKSDCYFWRFVRNTKAPYVPNIMHELDTSNFEDYDDNGTLLIDRRGHGMDSQFICLYNSRQQRRWER